MMKIRTISPIQSLLLRLSKNIHFVNIQFISLYRDDTIILRKRNRVGLKLCVKVDEVREMNILSLILKWKNELTSMTSDKGQEWRETRVKVLLGKS